MPDQKEIDLNAAACRYHEGGKLAIMPTTPLSTQADLSLAYTPGVAYPVKAIAEDPKLAYRYTSKGNLVAVISNGSAILGLGNLGALASKPVMEGKAVLFKHFAGVDVFDIEVDADTPEQFIETVSNISPTFGGINLEDIKAPECFMIEQALQARLNIPVFHDDQHGTAIVVAAGLLNALQLAEKKIEEVRVVCLGAGAAGIACMSMLHALGCPKVNLFMLDRGGVIHQGRQDISTHKQMFATQSVFAEPDDVFDGADVFIGVSGPNLFNETQIMRMAKHPIVFALSNPDPEIDRALAVKVRPDVIIATGRSDYPNQVNNVLCFPYIFRGALDACATAITTEMKIAAVHAIKDIVHDNHVPETVMTAYGLDKAPVFGRDYFIPKVFDPRLPERVPKAVQDAAS
jgi:malate dehydrogenase (oxaloacetate-decarboxylating)(NADP+)